MSAITVNTALPKSLKRLFNKLTFKGARERFVDVCIMFKVIFNVAAWDYSSLLIIIEAWLSRMQKCHEIDTWHKDADKRVKEIKFTRNLLKRLISGEYSAVETHYECWGEPKYTFEICDNDSKYSVMKVNYSKANTEELKKLEREEFGRAVKHDRYLEQQDYNWLFKTLNKHLRGWWS